MEALVLLLLAVPASLAAPLQEEPYVQAEVRQALHDEPAADADVQYLLEDDADGPADPGDYGWEALSQGDQPDTVDVPLDDVDWSLDQLPPSVRRALRLVLFENYKANFT